VLQHQTTHRDKACIIRGKYPDGVPELLRNNGLTDAEIATVLTRVLKKLRKRAERMTAECDDLERLIISRGTKPRSTKHSKPTQPDLFGQ
jgi:hypothetical protein